MPRRGVPSAAEGAEAIASLLSRHGVPDGGRVLDVPCGIGRRALGLAERGFEVVGVDANAVEIEAARSRVPVPLRNRLRYETVARAEWPGSAAPERFGAVLCLDHAVFRESNGSDVSFLRRLRDRLAPEGVLVLELLHRDFFATRARSFAFHVLGSMEQHEFRDYDPIADELTLRWTIYERVGEDLRYRMETRESYRLPTPPEVQACLAEADLRTDRVVGGWGDEPITADRRKVLFLARPVAHG